MPFTLQKSRHYLWIALIINTILLPQQCHALPFVVVNSDSPKCVSVVLATDTQFKVHYLLPDMAMYPKNERSEAEYERYMKELEEKSEEDKWDHSENANEKSKVSVQDRINAAFDDLKTTIESNKSPTKSSQPETPPTNPSDSSSSSSNPESAQWEEHQLPELTITDGLHSRTKRDIPPPPHPDADDDYVHHTLQSQRSAHKLRDVRGSIDHQTQSYGHVQICIRVPLATETRPYRIHLSLNEVHSEEDGKGIPTKEQELQTEITRHVYAMEADVMYLKRTFDGVLRTADMMKDLEMVQHKQSVEMHIGAWRIPFLRVVVLVITGVVQSWSVGTFLKRRVFGY